MSPFDVEWEPAAEDELARIWLRSSDPDAVTQAQAKADNLLSRDPIRFGRHLSEGLYSIEVLPLVINYTVNSTKRMVQVSWVVSK